MSTDKPVRQVPIVAAEAPPRERPSVYPPAFARRVEGRLKRPLGDLFGLTNFGVNHTRLSPGSCSALRHAHTRQDEFVYVLAGRPTLVTDAGEFELEPGMCIGFPAGTGEAHHILNLTEDDVLLLEVGDRSAGDNVSYPADDLVGVFEGGRWHFTRKDGSAY